MGRGLVAALATLALALPAVVASAAGSKHASLRATPNIGVAAPARPAKAAVAFDPRGLMTWALLKRKAVECQCEFTGGCSCQSSMAFMDCIAAACTSGKCACTETQYLDSCGTMAGVCKNLEFKCSKTKVLCAMDSPMEASDAPVPIAPPQGAAPETAESVGAELESLRLRRCELEAAERDGWLNADNRLRELVPVIEERLKRYEELGGAPPPYMGCGDPPPQSAGPAAEEQPASEWKPVHRAAETTAAGFWVVVGYYAGGLISLIILCVATFLVHRWHSQMVAESKGPHCGIRSILCCICCTPFVICCPIDAKT